MTINTNRYSYFISRNRLVVATWSVVFFVLTVAWTAKYWHSKKNLGLKENSPTGIGTMGSDSSKDASKQSRDRIQVAFIGNSILYYNDCPRLLQHMLEQRYQTVVQDSCLHGGQNFVSLMEKGNGMAKKFATPNARLPNGSYDIGSPTVSQLLTSSWDYIVMNDHTQAPAREKSRKASLKALKSTYRPLVKDSTVIFIQTAAYRRPVKNSTDLGDFDDFTDLLRRGYDEYKKVLPNAKVAPVGMAYQYIKHTFGNKMWEKLYAIDDFHPSPHGTLLEASVVYCTMVGERPPVYDATWWETARYMQPPDEEQLPIPTNEEAKVLQDVACHVCDLGNKGSCENPGNGPSHL